MKKLTTLAAGLLLAQFAMADGTPAVAGPQYGAPEHPVPQTPSQWLDRMTDFTRNASAYRDPKVFVPWFNAVTEPGFYTQMGINMMEPGNWYRMFGSMLDPRSLTNYMQFADPNMYMKWMAASMDPNFYTALMTTAFDPGKYMRWMMSPMDPQAWNMMMQTLNPNMYLKWMMAPLDPRLLSLGTAPLNPNLYTSWLGQSMNPATYGSWGTWMNPATYSVPGLMPTTGAPGAPAGTFNPFDLSSIFGAFGQPYGQPAGAPPAGQAVAPAYGSTFNFFDPNSWTNMFNPAAMTAPAAPTAPAPAKK